MRRLVPLALLFCTLLASPQAASAAQVPLTGWEAGWVAVRTTDGPGDGCTAWTSYYTYCGVQAWRWSNVGWSPVRLALGTQVYVSPWGGGWSWAWTSKTNWIAIQTSDLVRPS